jgi:hypothetical protein
VLGFDAGEVDAMPSDRRQVMLHRCRHRGPGGATGSLIMLWRYELSSAASSCRASQGQRFLACCLDFCV